MSNAPQPESTPRRPWLYIAGSADPNPGRGGYAAVWRPNEGQERTFGSYHHTTSVRLAMRALIEALPRHGDIDEVAVVCGVRHLTDAFQLGWWKQ